MVDLPSGKMKSREGTVVDADDLMQEMVDEAEKQTRELSKIEDATEAEIKSLSEMIGLGALKFFLLKVDPKKECCSIRMSRFNCKVTQVRLFNTHMRVSEQSFAKPSRWE